MKIGLFGLFLLFERYHRGVRSAKGGGMVNFFRFLAIAWRNLRLLYRWGDTATAKKPRKSHHLAQISPNVET